MMKPTDMVKLERDAAAGLATLLNEVPFAHVEDTQFEMPGSDNYADFVLSFQADGRPHRLVCEVKANGQPRQAREAIMQLRNHVAHGVSDGAPVFIAPYVSEEVRRLCRENGVNYYDLQGNCQIILAGIYIERSVATRPVSERRELRSLFKPKSARVLRWLLRDPGRVHRLAEVAAAAQVSIGQVHNVKEALLAREWAASTSDGFSLVRPGALLDAWRSAYEFPPNERHTFYTTLHGRPLEDAVRTTLREANAGGRASLASFSAADWIAPYVRSATLVLYADEASLDVVRDGLKLMPEPKGANVLVMAPYDEGVFLDSIEPAPGLRTTSPVQTYLDLTASGERGAEAADHLRRERLPWST
jgi:hypothetical protein